MEKRLAKISSAKLEIKDRGILNFWILVDYECGCSQVVGGMALDQYSKAKSRRVGTAYGCEMIRRCLVELNVDDFSEMKGKYIWVYGEGRGMAFTVKGFEALNVDKSVERPPFIFEEVYKEFESKCL